MKDETGTFRFAEIVGLGETYFVEVDLNPEERKLLRELAVQDGPLWKIQNGLIDYQVHLKDNLARLNLNDPNELKLAREISSEIKAVDWQYRAWQRLLTIEQKEGTLS